MIEGRLEWGKVVGQGKRGDDDWRATGTVIGDQYFFTLYVNGFDRMNHQLVIQLFGSCRRDWMGEKPPDNLEKTIQYKEILLGKTNCEQEE